MTALTFDQALKTFGLVGAVGSFLWGVFEWGRSRSGKLAQAKLEADRAATSRRLEATKPFLERQLTLYIELSQIVAILSTSSGYKEHFDVEQQFWRLYWGRISSCGEPGG